MESKIGEEISVPEEKPDRAQTVNEMVKLFGSERRKRAFSAAQKNQLDSEVLETALEPAFSHHQTKTDAQTPLATGQFPLYFSADPLPELLTAPSSQSSGLMPSPNLAAESPQDVYDLHDSILLIC